MGHTPGRWKRAGTSVLTQDGGLVASVYDGGDYSAEVCGERRNKHVTVAANAQLIAAAPEMLDALKAMTKLYVDFVNSGDCGCWDPERIDEVKLARAVIAKAEGK